jgi:multidrug efflux pump subunit AcrA (membrane-fusion protein)
MRYFHFCSLVLLFAFVVGCKPKLDEVLPKIGPVTEAVFASGSIDPKDAYIVTSLSDGFITKSYVTENDLVSDHQLLFELDSRQQHTQVNIAQTNLNYAKINATSTSPAIMQLQHQLESARAKMQSDSVLLSRYVKLYATNSVSKQDVDNARFAYESSLNTYHAAADNLQQTTDKLKQDLDNNREQLKNAEEGFQYYKLFAIGKSKVYQVFKKQGDLVRRGEQVAQLGNPDSIVINLDVDEGSIAKLKLGQQVLVELNTEKNKVYHAVISKIYPHFNETSQSYKVEARFTENYAGVIAGTQLQANIITARKTEAMLIPHIFLLGDSRVVVKKADRLDTVSVATGIVAEDWVEIISGISATDKIVRLK